MISRKHKTLEDSMMKTVILTPNSSVKSSVTVDSKPSETRDSFYFPGCRKDANCNCEICIASINATLDLMPLSSRRSSKTKFPASKISISRSPVSFNPSSADPSTPKSSARTWNVTASPPPSTTETIICQEKVKRRKEELGYGILMGFLKARLSPDVVKNLGLKSRGIESFERRFVFLKNELEWLVGNEVSSCSSGDDTLWKIDQDEMLLNSLRAYKSMVEEVSIWGWPLQTAGLLTAEYSSRTFTVISGRVTEWSVGEAKYSVRKDNSSSWAQGKWTASVVQFDPNTWILEYRRSFLMDNAKLVSAAVEFLKFRLKRELKKMKRDFWLVSAFGNQHFEYTRERIPPPT